jgi:hypothetical protein
MNTGIISCVNSLPKSYPQTGDAGPQWPFATVISRVCCCVTGKLARDIFSGGDVEEIDLTLFGHHTPNFLWHWHSLLQNSMSAKHSPVIRISPPEFQFYRK